MIKKTLYNELPSKFTSWMELYAKCRITIQESYVNKAEVIHYCMQDGNIEDQDSFNLDYILSLNYINHQCIYEISALKLNSFDAHILHIALIQLERNNPSLENKLSIDKINKLVKMLSTFPN